MSSFEAMHSSMNEFLHPNIATAKTDRDGFLFDISRKKRPLPLPYSNPIVHTAADPEDRGNELWPLHKGKRVYGSSTSHDNNSLAQIDSMCDVPSFKGSTRETRFTNGFYRRNMASIGSELPRIEAQRRCEEYEEKRVHNLQQRCVARTRDLSPVSWSESNVARHYNRGRANTQEATEAIKPRIARPYVPNECIIPLPSVVPHRLTGKQRYPTKPSTWSVAQQMHGGDGYVVTDVLPREATGKRQVCVRSGSTRPW
eukprot:Tbor_TRINITY_DN1159_c0_g1::TRINITY_DN1159_c0_g1_i1::g.15645::m.15645